MDQNALFRKQALDKLASPERLDLLMQVTTPKGWLALLTICGVLVAVIAWSELGSLPERIDGIGILIRGGGLREIRVSGDGLLSRLDLRVNDNVTSNQVVGQVKGLGVAERVTAAQNKAEAAGREAVIAQAEDQATIQGLLATIQGFRADIERAQGQLAKARDDLASKQKALEQGLIVRSRVQDIERQIDTLQSQINSLNSQIGNTDSQIRAVEQRIRSRQDAAGVARRDFDLTKKGATDVSQIVSLVEGRVVEMKKRQGDQVHDGDVIAIVEPAAAQLEPVVFVPAESGKRIKTGMEVQVSPSTVKREEYGFIKGSVGAVGEYPISPEAVMATVKNTELTNQFLGERSKIEVRVTLATSPNTPSGYSWSSSSGPPFKIDGGTQVTVSIVVDRRPPISKVLPLVKTAIGSIG
jgi:HlyD family secretion protein